MFFILSKTIIQLFMPLCLIFMLWIGMVCIFTKGKPRKYLLFTIVIAALACNDIIANKVLSALEATPVNIHQVSHQPYTIVLGGVTKKAPIEDGRVAYGGGADRVLQAVELYKMGKTDTIVVTGGSGKLDPDGHVEAESMKKTLVSCGVPSSKIITEVNSKNTHENAKFTAKRLSSPQGILITSAFHMKRSIACFEKQGVTVSPYPVDYHTSPGNEWKQWYFPTPHALLKWELIFHEVIGTLIYKVTGYI